MNGKALIVKHSFTGNNITKYTVLSPMLRFLNGQRLVGMISKSFPTRWHNITKFGSDRVLMSMIMGSLSRVNRIK